MKSSKFLSRATLSRVLSASLTWTMTMGALPAMGAGGVDGVEFQPVPVNITDRCNALILKGTNKYRGYGFKMPGVFLSVDKNMEDLFEIIPKKNGQYTLRFGLYFPLKNDGIEIRRERSNLILGTCNDDIAIAAVNELAAREAEQSGVQLKKKNKKSKDELAEENKGTIYDNRIHTLSALPISSLDITLEGFPGMTKTIGFPENNILNYQNTDLIADFNIPDEDTYEDLKSHLTGNIGLVVSVRMNFAARSYNGRTEAEINTRNIAKSLENQLQLSGKTPTNTVVGQGDLRSFLASAIANTSVNVKTEESDSEQFNRMSMDLVNRIASQIPSLPQVPGQSWNPNSCLNNPNNFGCQQGMNPIGGNLPFDPLLGNSNGMNQGMQPPAIGPQGQVLQPAPVNNDNGFGFNVGAVVNFLKQQQKITLVLENLGKRETHSYTTAVAIRGDIPTPGYKTLNIIADDVRGVGLTNEIKKGQQVILKFPSKRELITSYKPNTQYLSTDEIRRQGIAPMFPDLADAIAKNLLYLIPNKQNGGYMAAYRKNGEVAGPAKLWRSWYNKEDMTLWDFNWGIAELRQSIFMESPTDLDLDNYALNRLPLKVLFSAYGTRFRISELATETAKWSGRFVDNQIVFIAKEDLGIMTIRNYDKVVAPAGRRAEKYLFEAKLQVMTAKEKAALDAKSLTDKTIYSWVKLSDQVNMSSDNYVLDRPAAMPNLSEFKVVKSVYVAKVSVTTPGSSELPLIEVSPEMTAKPLPEMEDKPTPFLNVNP